VPREERATQRQRCRSDRNLRGELAVRTLPAGSGPSRPNRILRRRTARQPIGRGLRRAFGYCDGASTASIVALAERFSTEFEDELEQLRDERGGRAPIGRRRRRYPASLLVAFPGRRTLSAASGDRGPRRLLARRRFSPAGEDRGTGRRG
jgi:hypothetical protein